METRPLRLYTRPSEHPQLPWSWVDGQLSAAGTFWIVTTGGRYPHPRPVWGVWHDLRLHVSVGSPALVRDLQIGRGVTVHLDSGIDVVIVEGDVEPPTRDRVVLDAYDAKYDYRYDADQFGPLITIRPRSILAWRTAGPAGRDSFQETGRWVSD